MVARSNESAVAEDYSGADKPIKKATVSSSSSGAIKKVKPRIERLLRNKGPQIHEHTKRLLTLKGVSSSAIMNELLVDLGKLAKPNLVHLRRTNEVFPFEDPNSLEFLTSKNDCSLFALASHSKKRAHNLVLGRTYDGHMLDMFEFGVENFASISAFKGAHKAIGSKPVIVFQGDQWSSDSTYAKLHLFFLGNNNRDVATLKIII